MSNRQLLAPSEELIRCALDDILASPEFRTSKRCQEFLRFIVEQTLRGRGNELKERTIGVEAFGRSPSYDTNEDGVVRIKASEVRRRLAAYYAGLGKDSPTRIDLPVGGYAPQFSTADSLGAIPEPLAPETVRLVMPAVPARERRRLPQVTYWSALAILVAVVVLFSQRRTNLLDEFWKPVLQSASPVLIATAYVPVYEREEAPASPHSAQSPRANAGYSPADQYVLLKDQYVGGGDLVAASLVSGLLSRMQRSFVVKVGSMSFQDLRSAPTVMIGYSSNQWSRVSSGLRFYIDDDKGVITDNGKPTSWYPRALDRYFHTDEDYAILSRVFDPQTNMMLVEVTGITQYGTEAAAEVVTKPDLLAAALRSAPHDWQHKNFQFVLHMNVISDYPAKPKVVASYYW